MVFEDFIRTWATEYDPRLQKIKADIESHLALLESANSIIQEKAQLAAAMEYSSIKLLQLKSQNSKLRTIYSTIITVDERQDKLLVRKLLRMGMLLNPPNRRTYLDYIDFVYNELQQVETRLLEMLRLLASEDKLLENVSIMTPVTLSKLKPQLETLTAQEKVLASDVQRMLNDIEGRLKIKQLSAVIGKSQWVCPRCGNRFVKIERNSKPDHGHVFTWTCWYCHNTEDADDQGYGAVATRWTPTS